MNLNPTEQMKKIAKSITAKYCRSSAYEFEDLYGEAIVEGIKAGEDYIKEKNTKKTTYIYMRIKYKLLNIIRSENAKKRKPNKQINFEELKLNEHQEYYYLGLETQENQEDLILKKEKRNELKNTVLEILNSEEVEYLSLYLKGVSTAVIAKKFGVDNKKVSNKIYYIKLKLKKKQYKFEKFQKIL